MNKQRKVLHKIKVGLLIVLSTLLVIAVVAKRHPGYWVENGLMKMLLLVVGAFGIFLSSAYLAHLTRINKYDDMIHDRMLRSIDKFKRRKN